MAKFVIQWSIQGVLLLIGIGVDLIPNIDTWIPSFVVWGIAIIWAVITTVYWLKSRKNLKVSHQTTSNIVKVENILILIHERMLKLKDKSVNEYVSSRNALDFLDLHKNIMCALEKDIDLQNVNNRVAGKKLSKNRERKRRQIDDLFDQILPKVSIEWTLDKLVNVVNVFDRLAMDCNSAKYKGLGILRNKDKQWQRLFEELQSIKTIYSDDMLSKMIDEYVDWSFGVSSLILWTDLMRKYIPTELFPTEYLQSDAFNPNIKIGSKMTDLRTDILTRIRELDHMNEDKIRIENTKVQLDAKNGDRAVGMEIKDTQADLSNVQIGVKAENMKEATGLSISATNAEFALSSKLIICSCGETIRSVTTCGYNPIIKCPKCGKEYHP